MIDRHHHHHHRPYRHEFIHISIDKLHKLIDAITYKGSKAMAGADLETKDNVASDVEDNTDGMIIDHYADNHWAELVEALEFTRARGKCPMPEDVQIFDGDYIMHLDVDPSIPDTTVEVLKNKMTQYIVNGVLYDWYVGVDQKKAELYLAKMTALGNEIPNMLRNDSEPDWPIPRGCSYKIR